MNFLDRCIAGLADPASIDDEIDRWHDGGGDDTSLHTYLGLTWEEWCLFVARTMPWATKKSHEVVDEIIKARAQAAKGDGDED